MKDLPFSGKSAFQHKDGTTQCLWLTYSSEKQALFFFFFELYALVMLKTQIAENSV